MTDPQPQRSSALIFGARNLGRAIIETLLEADWAVAPARAAFAFLSAAGGFLVAQGRAATHELLVTPLAETSVP